jgi:hypothetical protein
VKHEEQNSVVDEFFGWKWDYKESQELRIPILWKGVNAYMNRERRDWAGDANNRPEMLAALSDDEQDAMIALILTGGWSPKQAYRALLNLAQPQFAELWLKVKGLWKE